MARRRQMRIDPSVFLQQQGGGDEASQLAMAMEMLGFGKGQEGVRGQLALGREQLQEEAGYHGRGQDIEEKRLAEETKRTAGQEAFNQWVKEQEIERQKEERKYRADQLAGESMKGRLDVAKTMMSDTGIPIADRQKMWAQFDPAIKDMLAAGAEQADKTKVEELLPKLQAVYAKGAPKGELEALLAGYPKNILQRPEIDWQKEAQGIPAAQPGWLSRIFGGGAGTPTAPPVGQGGITPVQGRRGYGTVPGQETTGKPLTEIIGLQDPLRYIREQPKPPVEVVTEKPFSYEEGYPSAQPNYMSGIQTPLPMDVINRIESDPRYMSAEQELLKSAMDWWNKGAPAPSGGPSAMPPRILPLGQMAPY